MDKVTARINFIELALGSFEKVYEGEDKEKQRKDDLKLKIPLITTDVLLQEQLEGYVRLSEEELKDLIKELQHLIKELQREKNLLQEEKLKLMGPTGGKHCFVLIEWVDCSFPLQTFLQLIVHLS
ncbi:MAG: hypothetical protein JSR97_10305 [Verrucomicrobia bacterium]|nr:hypothetical protein [Verrucomicrobiota bacterium]